MKISSGSANAIALSDAPESTELVICALEGGHCFYNQLSSMGLNTGRRIKVLSSGGRGPVLVMAGDARLAVGHGMAKKIFVCPVQDSAVSGKRTLADSREGEEVRILKINGGGAIRQRLLDMGISRGSKLKVERYAPLRDPIQVTVKGYSLALRVAEGRLVDIE